MRVKASVSDEEAAEWVSHRYTRTEGRDQDEKVALRLPLASRNPVCPSPTFSRIFRLLILVFLPPKCFLFEDVHISTIKTYQNCQL